MQYCLEIEDLRFLTIVGILESERTHEQEVLINAKIHYHYDTIYLDYVRVVECIQDTICTNAYGLLEELIEGVCRELKAQFPTIISIDFHITKPQILPHCNVGVRAQKHFPRDASLC